MKLTLTPELDKKYGSQLEYMAHNNLTSTILSDGNTAIIENDIFYIIVNELNTKDYQELRIHRLDNIKFNDEYCIINKKYFKINKINEDTGIIICRNMHNISEKIKIHKSQVTFVEKSEVPVIFR